MAEFCHSVGERYMRRYDILDGLVFVTALLLTACLYAHQPRDRPEPPKLVAWGRCFWGDVFVAGQKITIGRPGEHGSGQGTIKDGIATITWWIGGQWAVGVYQIEPDRLVGEWWYVNQTGWVGDETITIRPTPCPE